MTQAPTLADALARPVVPLAGARMQRGRVAVIIPSRGAGRQADGPRASLYGQPSEWA